MNNKEEIKNIVLEYFNIWDLEVEGLDSIEDYEENMEMFNYIVNIQYEFISSKKDQIMKAYKNDNVKMYNELLRFENSSSYKKIMNVHDFALKLQSSYKRLYTLKNRRTKQNLFLRNELTKIKYNGIN